MPGRLIVLEGLDGSGKATLAARLVSAWRASGLTVGSLAFPRYGASVFADLVQEALYGRLGDLGQSVYGPALLFALDRRDARQILLDLLDSNDVVLLDRYITSNAAYTAARLGGPGLGTGIPQWIAELEVGRFQLPVPELQILLDVPVDVAQARALGRADENSARALDTFEADGDLQQRTAAMYRTLAANGYLSPWRVLRPDADGQLVLGVLGDITDLTDFTDPSC